MSDKLRFAVLGTGFWSHYQIPAWFEVGGVELVAVWNRTHSRALAVAEKFGVPQVYRDAETLFQQEQLDFVDIITEVAAHAALVELAAQYGVPVICQKPMAPDYQTAQQMVAVCRDAGVSLFVHENYRWQHPIREVKRVIDEGQIGKPFRGRFQFLHALAPFVWDNQPLLKTLPRLIVADQGSHQFDLARFFFGEAQSIYCQHSRVRDDILAEDVASALLRMGDIICSVDMSFVSKVAWEHFPEEIIFIEGELGTVELKADFWIHLTRDGGTRVWRIPPPHYAWADPAYDVNHASMVPIHQDFLRAFRSGEPPENTGEDNLKTMQLVYAAYESAARNQVVSLDEYGVGSS
ncbi:MAG: Gfo/Idh/MocA family oxidoreductase [Chloroflexota bacterium]|nr:Gfo/Idh/MocA family oxidoreductase [Chloroflexota bacterium]